MSQLGIQIETLHNIGQLRDLIGLSAEFYQSVLFKNKYIMSGPNQYAISVGEIPIQLVG